jgi:hypothetical protein
VPTDAPTAFFSYSRDDLEFVLRLAKDLKKAGANVWMDKLDIHPGQPWQRKIDEALSTCRRVLVILSPSSVDSDNVMGEVTVALDEKKEVIPVLYRECRVPLRLRLLQYADFRSDYSQGLAELLDTVGVEQQAATSAAAASATPEASQAAAPDTEQPQVAAQQARLEQERQAAEQARQEREKLAAAEKLRVEPQERERQSAAEKAHLEQQEGRRVEQQHSRVAESSALTIVPSAFKKIALAVCGIAVLAVLLYWALKPQEHTTTPTLTQPKGPETTGPTSLQQATSPPVQSSTPSTNSGTSISTPPSTPLPFFMVRLVTDDDLRGKSPEELRLLRNETYARHGRRFNDAKLQQYFDAQSWYVPRYAPNQFPTSLLSPVEQANIAFIQKYEEQLK